MRDNWLSNQVFTSYDDIVDHCCEAWNKLIDRPWTIMSIGMRDWAHGSRLWGTWYKPCSAKQLPELEASRFWGIAPFAIVYAPFHSSSGTLR